MMQPQTNLPGASTPSKNTSPLVWVLAGCITVVGFGGIVAAGAVWWSYRQAKSYATRALETSAGGEMKSVARLWSDVPALEGMTQSQTEMPLAIRVLARPFLDTLMRGLNNGKPAGHWDVAAYMAAGKTTHDVEAFYVKERMGKYGWEQQGGCANLEQATFCSFQKREGQKATGLLIVAADDQEHKSTALYFIRQEAQEEGDASGS